VDPQDRGTRAHGMVRLQTAYSIQKSRMRSLQETSQTDGCDHCISGRLSEYYGSIGFADSEEGDPQSKQNMLEPYSILHALQGNPCREARAPTHKRPAAMTGRFLFLL